MPAGSFFRLGLGLGLGFFEEDLDLDLRTVDLDLHLDLTVAGLVTSLLFTVRLYFYKKSSYGGRGCTHASWASLYATAL